LLLESAADWSSTPSAVPFADFSNPQTLNLYQFVEDDPESLTDLDGHGVPDPFIFDESGWLSVTPGLWPGTYGTTACLLSACYFAVVNPLTNTITIYLNQPTAQAQNQNQTQNKQQPQSPAQAVFNHVKMEFPGIAFNASNVQDLGAHNGHENIAVTGTASEDQLKQIQETLKAAEGTSGPGSRINRRSRCM
jgi:hypothetical protein